MVDISNDIYDLVEEGIRPITTEEVWTRTERQRRFAVRPVKKLMVGAAAAIVVLALVLIGTAVVTTRPSSGEAIPNGQVAIQDAEQIPGAFSNVTRAAAKEMNYAEFRSAVQSGISVNSTTPGSQLVWVVAISGTVHPQFDMSGSTDQWGVIVFDAQSGHDLVELAGTIGSWPPFFDQLPDHT